MAERRGILGRAYRIARVGGVDLNVDVSWLIIAAIIVWSFWGRFDASDDVGAGVALGMAVVGALLFFGSVLAHELAHALEARQRGVTIAGITLFLFGGVTESKFDVKRPRDELALTAAGPFTSFVLAAGFGLIATAFDTVAEVALVAGLLGWVNLALGVFNLLPGAPLDGGRILRAIVWWVTGNRLRAIRIAAGAGFVVAALLMGLGFLALFSPGGFVGGVWFLLIGWFLMQGASAEWSQAQLQELLGDVPVSRLVDRRLEPVPAGISLADVFEGWVAVSESDVFPVHENGDLVGVIGVEELRVIDQERWESLTAEDAMTPIGDLPSVDESRMAGDVLGELVGQSRVVVATENGDPDGLITTRRLVFVARRASELGGFGSREADREHQPAEPRLTDRERTGAPR